MSERLDFDRQKQVSDCHLPPHVSICADPTLFAHATQGDTIAFHPCLLIFCNLDSKSILSDHEGVSDRGFGRVVEEIVAASNYSNPFAALEEESEEESEEEDGEDLLRVVTLLLLYLLLFEICTLWAILLPQC